MISIIKPCPNCQKDLEMYVGQHAFIGEKMGWWKSYSCSYCGIQIEEDDYGIPPNEIREAILAQEGTWSLDICETEDRVVVVKILREALKLSLNDAIQLKYRIPGKVLEGTRVEVNRLKRLLAKRGFQSSASKPEI